MKKPIKSRSLWLNYLTLLIAVGVFIIESASTIHLFTQKQLALIGFAVGILNIILRYNTNMPLDIKRRNKSAVPKESVKEAVDKIK